MASRAAVRDLLNLFDRSHRCSAVFLSWASITLRACFTSVVSGIDASLMSYRDGIRLRRYFCCSFNAAISALLSGFSAVLLPECVYRLQDLIQLIVDLLPRHQQSVPTLVKVVQRHQYVPVVLLRFHPLIVQWKFHCCVLAYLCHQLPPLTFFLT